MDPKPNTRHRFKPGEGGRPKGSPNRVSTEHKQRVEWVLELLEENLEQNILKLKPKDQVDLWMNLQEYIRPKLQRMNVDINPVEDKLTRITFEVIHSTILPESNIKALPIGIEDTGIRSIPEKL
jgi:hypothetical protein